MLQLLFSERENKYNRRGRSGERRARIATESANPRVPGRVTQTGQPQTIEEHREPMTSIPWAKEFPGTITVCDAAGVILDMNDHACAILRQGRRPGTAGQQPHRLP